MSAEPYDDAARERDFNFLFGHPRADHEDVNVFQPPQSTHDAATDLLLATIDERLAEDATLGKIDAQTEAALEANEVYSAKIRKMLEDVVKALERGEELEVSRTRSRVDVEISSS